MVNYYLMVFRKYAVFKGIASRPEYWYFVLFNLIISIILSIINSILNNDILGTLYSLVILIPSIAVSVRRLHDIGKSGWMMLILLIPLIGFIWFIVLMARPSKKGENKYNLKAEEINIKKDFENEKEDSSNE